MDFVKSYHRTKLAEHSSRQLQEIEDKTELFDIPKPNDSSMQKPRSYVTLDFHNKWKATLFSKQYTHRLNIEGKEWKRTMTLYYVEVKTSNSEIPRRIWQRSFVITPSNPQSIPKSFILGPGNDENHLCLAFIQGYTVYFFTFDSRGDLSAMEYVPETKISTTTNGRLDEYDPNAIVLSQALGKEYIPMLAENETNTSIDAISFYANHRAIHLSIGKQNFILYCLLHSDKTTNLTYQLNK